MSMKRLAGLVVALGLVGALIPATALANGASYWNVAGTYNVDVTWDQDPIPNTIYPETLILTQSGTGTITGTSLCFVCFTITSGSVVGDAIAFDGVYGGSTTRLTGTIAAGGSMSGTWADIIGGSRTGTWATTSGTATSVPVNSHEMTDLVPYPNGPALGAVIFNSSASTSNLEMTVQTKKVTPNTSYDVYIFIDGYTSGTGIVVGTLTTNDAGNGTFHINTQVTPGIHTVAVDVTFHGSGNDVFVTPGLYGQNLFMDFR